MTQVLRTGQCWCKHQERHPVSNVPRDWNSRSASRLLVSYELLTFQARASP